MVVFGCEGFTFSASSDDGWNIGFHGWCVASAFCWIRWQHNDVALAEAMKRASRDEDDAVIASRCTL